MFDRNAKVGGAHVGQQGFAGCYTPNCGPSGRRTWLGADGTVAGAPYAPTTIPGLGGTPTNTIGSSAAGTAFMLTYTPKCPVKAVALFMDPDNLATELTALYVGAQGAQNGENLLANNGANNGWVPATLAEDSNACMPVLEAGPANFMCPFILVGRTVSGTNTTQTVRSAMLVEIL